MLIVYSLEPRSVFARGTIQAQEPSLITQEIRYHMPAAGEVFLVWGVNGWSTLPEEMRPPRTQLKDGLMYSPMDQVNEGFVIQLEVPPNTTIDYVFQILAIGNRGEQVEVWDVNGDPKQDYHTVATQDGIAEVYAPPAVTQQLAKIHLETKLQWRGLLLVLSGLGVVLVLSVIIIGVPYRKTRSKWLNLYNDLRFQRAQINQGHSTWWWRQYLVAILLGATVVVLLVTTAPKIGLTWDEPVYIWASESYVTWLGELATHPGYALSDEGIRRYWELQHDHPPFNKVWSGLVWTASRSLFDNLTAHRLGNILLTGLFVSLLYVILAKTYSWVAGLAAVGGLITMPRFFFHAQLAALDVPVTAIMFSVVFIFWFSKNRSGLQWGVWLGLAWGLALATKINAILMLPMLFFWILLFERRWFLFGRLVLMGLVGFTFSMVIWPWLYHAPIIRYSEYLAFILFNHWQLGQWYLGQLYVSLPWHFPFVMLLAVIPLSLTILCIVGGVHIIKGGKSQGLGWLFILSIALFILPVSVGSSAVFDNERLFMPSFPFIAAIMGIGFDRVIFGIHKITQQTMRFGWTQPLILFVIIISFIPQIVVGYQLFPHLLSYYSEIVGGVRGAKRLGLETTYWSETYIDALSFLNDHAQNGATIWAHGGSHHVLQFYQSEGKLRRDLQVLSPTKEEPSTQDNSVSIWDADYVLLHYRQTGFDSELKEWLPGQELVYQLSYRDVPLMEIYINSAKNPLPTDKLRESEKNSMVGLDSSQSYVTQDIRYQISGAGKVYLVWGINGWFTVPESSRPLGTEIRDGIMYTPMIKCDDDIFTSRLEVPTGTTIDYVFLITKTRHGAAVEVWDSNGDPKKDYHKLAERNGVIDVKASPVIQSRVYGGILDTGLQWGTLVLTLGGAFIFFRIVAVRELINVVHSTDDLKKLISTNQQSAKRCLMLQKKIQFWTLIGIMLLGAMLRVNAAIEWNSLYPNSFERLRGDEREYDSIASELLQKYDYNRPSRVPLYPVWLAGVKTLTNGSYSAIPHVQTLLGIVVIPLTYLLGRRIFGSTAGLIAAFLAAISYALIHQSVRVLSEVLYTPIILLVAITFWDALRTSKAIFFFWSGFWLAVSALTRPALLFFPIVAGLVIVIILKRRQALRYWIIYIVATVLLLTPWMVHNYIRQQALIPLQTSKSVIWLGSPEYFHLVRDQGYTYGQIWEEVLYLPDFKEHDPDSVSGDRWWTQRALRSIKAEPFIYFKYAIEKLGTYWIGDPNADWGDTYVFNYQALLNKGLTPLNAKQYMIARIIPIITLLAGLILRRKWQTLLPIYALIIYSNLLHAATHAEARLSDPLQPFLLIIIAGAIVLIGQTMVRRVLSYRPVKQQLRGIG